MRNRIVFTLLAVGIIAMVILNVLIGSVNISLSDMLCVLTGGDRGEIVNNIVWKSRVPQTVVALLAGGGLSVAGLQMQTVFRNPLAGPSVLGISSGASLGVALLVLLSGTVGEHVLLELGYVGEAAIVLAAIVGAWAVMLLIIAVSQIVSSHVYVLIIGVMIGYVTNSIIGILKFFSPEEEVKAFVVWGLGSFSRISGDELWFFIILMLLLLPLPLLMAKTMNMMLLGDDYASNLGLNINRSRSQVIITSGIIVAVVTAYCGPILFIGFVVPHVCRILFLTSDNRILLPASLMMGSCIALACNLLARLPGMDGVLPVNSVMALFGAPVIVHIILTRRRWKY